MLILPFQLQAKQVGQAEHYSDQVLFEVLVVMLPVPVPVLVELDELWGWQELQAEIEIVQLVAAEAEAVDDLVEVLRLAQQDLQLLYLTVVLEG